MKHILTAITLALASCASAPATASTEAYSASLAIGASMCSMIEDMVIQVYNNKDHLPMYAVMDMADGNPYVIAAVSGVYNREFATDQVAARILGRECRSVFALEVARAMQ